MFLHFGEKIGKYGGDLEVGKGVEGEDNCGDDDETDGDERHNLNIERFLSSREKSSSRASPLLRVMCVVFQRGPTSTSGSDQGCPVGRTLVPQPGSGRC